MLHCMRFFLPRFRCCSRSIFSPPRHKLPRVMSSNPSVLALAVALLPLAAIAHLQPAATTRTTAATTRATAPSLYIDDVTVIDTETGQEALHRTVKILGGRISAVVAARTVKASSGARTVSGSGKFLIPGL